MKVFLFIDDERKNNSAIDKINLFTDKKAMIYISFDHDLGLSKTGYDVAKYIVENQIKIEGFQCHSMNPVGRRNIEDLLIHYGYKSGLKF